MASAPPVEDSAYLAVNPTLPYVEEIPGGVFPGRAILIKGSVLENSVQKRFWIDLCCGLLVHGDHSDNKALHFNPRFETGSWFFSDKDDQIVINSLVNNIWGVEERYNNVFKPGAPFSIRILVLSEYYKIMVNGRHLCDYLHRLKSNTVSTVYVGGNITVDYIQIQGEVGRPDIPEGDKTNIAEIKKPKIPFGKRIEGIKEGSTLVLTATPLMNAERFVVNLFSDNEYFLHFRVDFKKGKEKAGIVRNSTTGGKWQKEEREMSEFPFNHGLTFDLKFIFTADSALYHFIAKELTTNIVRDIGRTHDADASLSILIILSCQISVDGDVFGNFMYRESKKLYEVNRITILGDIAVQIIKFNEPISNESK